MNDRDNEEPNLKNNIDRALQRGKTRDVENLKKKYAANSHTENVNKKGSSSPIDDSNRTKPKFKPESSYPLLDKRRKKAQNTDVNNKNHLSEEGG